MSEDNLTLKDIEEMFEKDMERALWQFSVFPISKALRMYYVETIRGFYH